MAGTGFSIDDIDDLIDEANNSNSNGTTTQPPATAVVNPVVNPTAVPAQTDASFDISELDAVIGGTNPTSADVTAPTQPLLTVTPVVGAVPVAVSTPSAPKTLTVDTTTPAQKNNNVDLSPFDLTQNHSPTHQPPAAITTTENLDPPADMDRFMYPFSKTTTAAATATTVAARTAAPVEVIPAPTAAATTPVTTPESPVPAEDNKAETHPS